MRFIKLMAGAVRGSLKVKLILVIVGILALTIGVAPWSAIKMQERQLMQASRQRLRALHDMLSKTIVAACMLSRQRRSIQEVLEAVSSHQDIRRLRLFDAHGVISASSQPAERGKRLSTADLSRYYGHDDPFFLTESGGKMTYTLVKPMFNGPTCVSCHPSESKVLGVLQVSLSLDRVWQQLDTLKRSALLATLTALAVIVIAIWLALTFFVDQPLQHLIRVMSRAERGDLGARVEVHSSDELGTLTRNFNDMISKLQVAHRELERYHQEQLARADRLATIGEMAAAIAHEIRNPLTGISGVLSVLSRDFPADDPRREIVHQTYSQIERLNKSVEDILRYSRPSLPQLQTVTVAQIVDRALSLVEGEARKAGVRIVKEGHPGPGAGDRAPTVRVDPHQIQQVVINLVLNSIQATGAGGQVRIRARGSVKEAAPNSVCIEVEDTGKGMTAQEAAKAFQPFFTTKAQGTGLGLPIAKQIVERHQGQISIRSAPGEGTCVQVRLPAYLEAPAAGAPARGGGPAQ